jgi:hypothetical protein
MKDRYSFSYDQSSLDLFFLRQARRFKERERERERESWPGEVREVVVRFYFYLWYYTLACSWVIF